MTKLLCAFTLLIATLAAHADTITVNPAGGLAFYTPHSSTLLGTDGGTYWYGAYGLGGGGRFSSGYLTAIGPEMTLVGSLSHAYFNAKSGLFQAAFIGRLQLGTSVIHVYHATFYESVNLQQGTNRGGYLVYSTAPEPSTWALFITGLVAISLYRVRRQHGA